MQATQLHPHYLTLPPWQPWQWTDVSLAGRDNGMNVSKAMQQLQAAPQLADMEDWSQWVVPVNLPWGILTLSCHSMVCSPCLCIAE